MPALRRSKRTRTKSRVLADASSPSQKTKKTSQKTKPTSRRSSSRTKSSTVVRSTVPSEPKIGHYTLSQVDRSLLKTALVEYKYISPPKSICEQLYLVKFWDRVAETYPEWLAPNTVTFFGYLCSVACVAMTLYFNGTFPDWYWLVAAALLCAYQTADGSDGPQARRLRCGSALGELFDHGVDAIVTTFISFITLFCCGYGMSTPISPIMFVCTMSAFFFSNATLLHTSCQLFNPIDAQEIQLTAQALMVATYVFGQEQLWKYAIPLPVSVGTFVNQHLSYVAQHANLYVVPALGAEESHSYIELRGFLTPIVLCATLVNSVGACNHIRAHYANVDASVRVTGRTLPEFWHQVCSMLLFFGIMIVTWFRTEVAVTSTHDALAASSTYAFRLWFLSACFAYADHVNHVLVLRVAKIPFPSLVRTRCIWLMSLFGIWTELGNRAVMEGGAGADSPFVVYGDVGRGIIFLLCFGSHLYYSVTVGGAIAQSLGVQFFFVPVEKQQAFLKSKK
jgi:phosphatidylglycerophosphate synthase